MKPSLDTAAFDAQALAQGYEELLDRQWAPLTVVDIHTHPFDAKAVLTQGEMWLTVDGQTRHLQAGDGFELAREVPHAERYGPEGAIYRVARRSGKS